MHMSGLIVSFGMLLTGRLVMFIGSSINPSSVHLLIDSFGFSINTITTKLADIQCVTDYRMSNTALSCSTTANGSCSRGCRSFNHPFAQVTVLDDVNVNRLRSVTLLSRRRSGCFLESYFAWQHTVSGCCIAQLRLILQPRTNTIPPSPRRHLRCQPLATCWQRASSTRGSR